MPRPSWLSNPWARNPWFETVAVAQSRAKKRLPWSVYGALLAGSERGVSADEIVESWSRGLEQFRKRREAALLYH